MKDAPLSDLLSMDTYNRTAIIGMTVNMIVWGS